MKTEQPLPLLVIHKNLAKMLEKWHCTQSSHLINNCLTNFPFRSQLLESRKGLPLVLQRKVRGNECENKAGESSKSLLFSSIYSSGLDPETVIRARCKPRDCKSVVKSKSKIRSESPASTSRADKESTKWHTNICLHCWDTMQAVNHQIKAQPELKEGQAHPSAFLPSAPLSVKDMTLKSAI